MYFITGATGLVGSTLAKALAIQGKKVKVFYRSESDLSLLEDIKGDIIRVEGSIYDSALLIEELKDVHTIIHAAALVSFEKKDEQEIYETNVLGTRSLVDAALISGVDKFIYVSSVAAIGRKKNTPIINEKTQWVESSLNSAYGKSKHLGELEVWRGFEEGLNGFIVNPSIILGKGDWNKSSAKLIKFIYEHQTYYPLASLNFVDLRDVRDVILKLMEKNICGERFILNGGQQTYKELFEYSSLLFNITHIRKPISVTKLRLVQLLVAFKAFITQSSPLLTKETITALRYSYTYDTSKVETTVNHKFNSLQDTLEDIVPYYINKYKL
jgi:nucleoside-diphosphate-sugar epimerase